VYLLKKETIRKIEKYSIVGPLSILMILFVISISIGQTEKNRNNPPSSEDIIAYARLFLPGGSKEEYGAQLDCSGFTKAVYNKYSIHLPSSSAGQYRRTKQLEKEDIRSGDLLFFNTSGNGISHVAICMDSIRFIHSPGKGRGICIDSLEQLYWNKRFICGGKVNFKNKN